jgi:hypothetical protein
VIARGAGPIWTRQLSRLHVPQRHGCGSTSRSSIARATLALTGGQPAEHEHRAGELPPPLAIVEMILELTIALTRGAIDAIIRKSELGLGLVLGQIDPDFHPPADGGPDRRRAQPAQQADQPIVARKTDRA